jgi:hypothetical protein
MSAAVLLKCYCQLRLCFVGELSVGPAPLLQVMPEAEAGRTGLFRKLPVPAGTGSSLEWSLAQFFRSINRRRRMSCRVTFPPEDS